MSVLKMIGKVLEKVFLPIQRNTVFFVFMYVLGIVASYLVLPNRPKVHIYNHAWVELFVDLYVVCLILSLIPAKVRPWLRVVCYVIAYATTLVDVFCFVKFQSTLNPTMLLLVGETDSREASEFLSSYLNGEVLFSGVGVILLLMVANILVASVRKWWGKMPIRVRLVMEGVGDFVTRLRPLLGAVVIGLLIKGVIDSQHNKSEMAEMFSKTTIGQVEHELTTKDCAQFYLPVYRLAFSIFSNQLASRQITQLLKAKDRVQVDSCTFRSPTIVLIIGESYNKYHSQLYGYELPTTPRQVKREQSGGLVRFTNVVAPWNLTSFVFKNVFSMHVVGQDGEWCDYPLFPEIFRKAGYHVTFLTNQFLPKAKEAVYDFSGGFFLNNPELSAAQFDTRNKAVHRFDDGILKDYDALGKGAKNQLIIFHLMGQHVDYHSRYPKSQRKWYKEDYDRPDLTPKKRDILSHYDNATLYNDSIVDQILSRFEDQSAIVIYMPDHGEECFGEGYKYHGRNHSEEIGHRVARQEFEIPFWIWCSHQYAVEHPDVLSEIIQAKDRRLMTDALPHTLLYLAGIYTKDYHQKYNVLSPDYDEMRPRILKGKTDYDKVMAAPEEKSQETGHKP